MERYELSARRITECLNEFDIRPIELSKRTGIDRSLISMYAKGKRCPSNINAGKMSEVFKGVSPVWLMGFDVDKMLSPEQQADEDFDLMSKFKKLSKAHQQDVLNFIDNLLRSES